MSVVLDYLTVITDIVITGGGISAIIAGFIQVSKSNNHAPITYLLGKIGEAMTKPQLDKLKDDVMVEVVEMNADLKNTISERIDGVEKVIMQNKRQADFKDDSGWANFIRLQIKQVVKNMRSHDYIPDDEELATEYYEMCLWYERFAEKYSNPNSEFFYENNKMSLACEYYVNWYKEQYMRGN